MSIPDFQTIMLPLVKFCRDQQQHTNREALDSLAEKFNLTEEERGELLPSGQQAVFDNRVAWARAHLKMTNELIQEDYASRIENRMVLIDGESLAQLMIDHGVGVTSVAAYEIKRVDSDYFTEE